MQTNFRNTNDPAQQHQGPLFTPEVRPNVDLRILEPKSLTCCDCCCGGRGRGCSLENGLKSISVWHTIVSLIFFILFVDAAIDPYLASEGFFALLYSILHGLSAFEGFRFVNFEYSQEYHVRGKRLHAIYVIILTLNTCIATAFTLIAFQVLIYGYPEALIVWLFIGLPWTIHAYICHVGSTTLKKFFQFEKYKAYQNMQNNPQA